LADEYKQSVPREIKVADVPQVVQKNLQKQSEVGTKTPLASNKPKAESTQSNGKNNSGSKTVPPVNNHSSAVP
jgi:polyisoprenyl-teichoic acid--peptidoglycan teichoic acid transferase